MSEIAKKLPKDVRLDQITVGDALDRLHSYRQNMLRELEALPLLCHISGADLQASERACREDLVVIEGTIQAMTDALTVTRMKTLVPR